MRNYGLDCLCPAGSREELGVCVAFSWLGLAQTIQAELGERHSLVDLIFPFSLPERGLASMGWPLAAWQGHYPAAGASCWN